MVSGRPDWHSIMTVSGKYDNTFIPVKVDATGQMYIVLTGQELVTKDPHVVAVDGDGVMLSRMQGIYDVTTLKDVAVDSAGNMISRMKGIATGEVVLKILDDCGDTSTITDWEEQEDGLNPVDNQVYVKQGLHSMALGIDADKSGEDRARWINTQSQGDLSNYKDDWIYLWVYIPTLDYIANSGTAFQYYIGNDSNNLLRFYFSKPTFSIGWNLFKCDLNNPSYKYGTVNWTDITYQLLYIEEVSGNTHDFTVYIDSLTVIRPDPATGLLKDVAVDSEGLMWAKMTGEYAGFLKPVAIDQNGNMLAVMKGDWAGALKTIAVDSNGVMKANLSAQDIDWLRVRPAYGEAKMKLESKSCPTETETELFTVSGRGTTYGGVFQWSTVASARNLKPIIYIDGTLFIDMTPYGLNLYSIDKYGVFPYVLLKYDDTAFKYVVGVTQGITFESSIKFAAYNPYDNPETVTGYLFYAVAPS